MEASLTNVERLGHEAEMKMAMLRAELDLLASLRLRLAAAREAEQHQPRPAAQKGVARTSSCACGQHAPICPGYFITAGLQRGKCRCDCHSKQTAERQASDQQPELQVKLADSNQNDVEHQHDQGNYPAKREPSGVARS